MAEEDLIFGKNRHFFGGIEPSNMATFSAVVDNGIVKITAELPSDTVINGQTLCTVAGAVIRRKATGYPADEFDGDLVIDISESGTFVDSTADPTATYLYAAFPYTTQGVYNINSANTSGINLPGDMVVFTAESVFSSGVLSVQLTATLPEGVEGAVIRKSTSGYPVSETDGEAVMTITSDGVYSDTAVSHRTLYYYSAFPYNNGVYKRGEENRAQVFAKMYDYFFGYDLDTTDSDPATRVSYPSDVENANYTPACMIYASDYADNTFDYGGWNIAPGEKFMPRPCMLTYAGVVDHYLDPNDYTKKTDGTSSSVTSTSFGGNAMMEWPKIYTKRWEENGVYHFRCSDSKIDDDWDCWCNYDKNNNEIDHFYTPIYNGVITNSKLRSISGLTLPTTSYGQSYDTYCTNATANGDDWSIETLSDRLLTQDLLVMISRTTDGQTAFGNGNSDGGGYINPGSLDDKGLFWGDDSSDSGVKVFGMEHFWGNARRCVAGWIDVNDVQKVKITRGTHDGSKATDYNNTGSGYLTIGSLGSYTTANYISTMTTKSYGRLPASAIGSSTTYECDGIQTITNTSGAFAVCGGYYKLSSKRLAAGPFACRLYQGASASQQYACASPSCKPSAT